MLDYKKSADDMMTLIKKVESEIGPRLPASEEEKKAAELLSAEYENTVGIKPVREFFKVAPIASIGAVPYCGVGGLIAFVLYYIYPLAAVILAAFCLFYALSMAIVYTSIFDVFWPKKDSSNLYTVQEPRGGKTDYTVMIGAHYDSSWHWPLQYKNPKTFIPKIAYGIVGVVVLIVCGIIQIVIGKNMPVWQAIATTSYEGFWPYFCLTFPVVFVPGIYFLTQFLSHDKKLASPGAMDNLTGIALTMQIAKYFNRNPEELPEGCRLVCASFGCEEAGLKGSKAFVKAHKSDGMLNNCYFINVDSISDYDYFEVVTGDPLQFASYDKEMIDMAYSCLEETGCIRKTGKIVNPIGGNDATPLHKAGVKAVTLAAQNPVPTNYYHTTADRSDRLDTRTFEEGLEVMYRLINKINEKESGKK